MWGAAFGSFKHKKEGGEKDVGGRVRRDRNINIDGSAVLGIMQEWLKKSETVGREWPNPRHTKISRQEGEGV